MTIVMLLASFAAGLLGSLLGLGGGIIIVPTLTLAMHIDIRYAIGASIVAVIATSSGSAAAYLKNRLSNIRVGMFLELATTTGALGGAMLAGVVSARWLYLIFGMMLILTAVAMWRKRDSSPGEVVLADALADRLEMHGSFPDAATGKHRFYKVTRTRLGFGVSLVAGLLSGLLGVGGGIMKVPAMSLGMGMPMKAATATSNLMIGVTAAASAGVYFMRGDINPFIAAPVALGVLVGATLGSRLMSRVHGKALRYGFAALLVIVSVQMILKGLR